MAGCDTHGCHSKILGHVRGGQETASLEQGSGPRSGGKCNFDGIVGHGDRTCPSGGLYLSRMDPSLGRNGLEGQNLEAHGRSISNSIHTHDDFGYLCLGLFAILLLIGRNLLIREEV